jgi:PAS domain S-box-containing protein
VAEKNSNSEEILDSLGEGLFTVDKNFRINFFNRAAEEITGYKREEVISKFCKNVFKADLCASKCPIALVLESGNSIFDYESCIANKLGERIVLKLNSAVLKNGAGEPVGGVVSFRNISDSKIIKDSIKGSSIFHGVIGHSKLMKEIFTLIEEISDSNAAILIQGESGTGKEMIANAIQKTSLRRDKPFIKVNCSVFPENLLASELFGHVKGAFTDAVKDRPGRFEIADEGTIFLDEVAEMPLQTQIQLLRVLQEGTFERVGESISRKTDVRVIAATNLNINEALTKGKLREDLYYRLNVIPIHVPPLRERKEDIPFLVQYFLQKYSVIYKKEINEISDEAVDKLIRYHWPGNVRELENVIEFAFVRTVNSTVITENKLPVQIKDASSSSPVKVNHSFSRESAAQLLVLLEKHHWNKSKVADELGIGRTTLWRKMKSLGIEDK